MGYITVIAIIITLCIFSYELGSQQGWHKCYEELNDKVIKYKNRNFE